MTWRPEPQPECGPNCTCRGSFESENDRLAEYVRSEHGRGLTEPRAVPHPLGGITYPVDPSQVGQWWEDHDPDPAPGGGDRLPTRASGA